MIYNCYNLPIRTGETLRICEILSSSNPDFSVEKLPDIIGRSITRCSEEDMNKAKIGDDKPLLSVIKGSPRAALLRLNGQICAHKKTCKSFDVRNCTILTQTTKLTFGPKKINVCFEYSDINSDVRAVSELISLWYEGYHIIHVISA